jgi:hypothetical protein
MSGAVPVRPLYVLMACIRTPLTATSLQYTSTRHKNGDRVGVQLLLNTVLSPVLRAVQLLLARR